jgi:hypothetical protein
VSAADLTGGDWARYARHASPEAIQGELSSLRGAARRAADRVSKMETLLARRCAEVADGTWPPPRPALAFAPMAGAVDGDPS